MKYTQKSFNSAPSSQAYRDNYDRIFKKKPKVDSGYPDVPEGLEAKIKDLRTEGDIAWGEGRKVLSHNFHSTAYELGKPFGLNPQKCDQCGVYMPERNIAQHKVDEHS